MFATIPIGEEVYGVQGFGILDWNKFEVENLEHMFNMINKVLDDVDLMVFVSSKHIVPHVGTICGRQGFKLHHVITMA